MPVVDLFVWGLWAGLEQQIFPSLRTQAVVMVREGYVVDVCTRSARAGVKIGMRAAQAHHYIPEALQRPAERERYGPQGEILGSVAYQWSSDVELLDLHRVRVGLHADEDPRRIVEGMLETLPWIHQAAAGCAQGPWMAEVARHRLTVEQIPEGVVKPRVVLSVIPRGQETAALAPLPVSFLEPVEARVRTEWEQLGIERIRDLQEFSSRTLRSHYGMTLSQRIRGIDRSCLVPNYPPLRLLWEQRLEGTPGEAGPHYLRQGAIFLAEQMRLRGLRARRWVLMLQPESGAWIQLQRHFTHPTRRVEAFRESLLREWHRSSISLPMLRLQVYVEDLLHDESTQLSLFTRDVADHEHSVGDLIEGVQSRYSRRSLFWGKNLSISRREAMLACWDPLRKR